MSKPSPDECPRGPVPRWHEGHGRGAQGRPDWELKDGGSRPGKKRMKRTKGQRYEGSSGVSPPSSRGPAHLHI